MNTYNLIYWDSAAWNLKYTLKQKKLKQKIVNFSDDLSIWPINDYFSDEWKESRKNWIMKNLFEFWREDYKDEYKIYLDEININFLNEIVKVNPEDKVIFWFSDSTQDYLFLWYALKFFSDHKNIFYVNISDTEKFKVEIEIYARSIAELSPDKLKLFIWKEKKFLTKDINKFIKIFEDLTKQSWTIRQILWDRVENIEENFYDQFILDSISLDYQKTTLILWKSLWKCFQIVSDLFFEYRVNKLIETGILKYQWTRDFMWNYSIKLNSDLFRNFETKKYIPWNCDWNNASEVLPVEGSEVMIWVKFKDSDDDLYKANYVWTYKKNFFVDETGLKRLPLIIQKDFWVFAWKYIEEFPDNFK